MSDQTPQATRRNPYVVFLITVGILSIVAALIMVIVVATVSSRDPYWLSDHLLLQLASTSAWAGVLGTAGVASVIAGLIVAGIRWTPSEPQKSPVVE